MTLATKLIIRWFQKTAYVPVKADQLEPALEVTLDSIRAIPLDKFQRVLLVAKKESPVKDRVWQKHFKAYLKEMDTSLIVLKELQSALKEMDATAEGNISRLLDQVIKSLKLPRKASTDYAISDIDISEDSKTGKDEISYATKTLMDWHKNLMTWVGSTEKACQEALTKVRDLPESSV